MAVFTRVEEAGSGRVHFVNADHVQDITPGITEGVCMIVFRMGHVVHVNGTAEHIRLRFQDGHRQVIKPGTLAASGMCPACGHRFTSDKCEYCGLNTDPKLCTYCQQGFFCPLDNR